MDESEQTSIEWWKTKCRALERQLSTLQQRNGFHSRQTEETHQQNLKLTRIIEDLKRKLQIPSKQNGQNHESLADYDLFFTFPEELWPFILMYVKNSSDLLSLGIASPMLETVLLRNDKTAWLFDQILPKIFKWLEHEEILFCRLVCRKWNLAVESHMDSYPKINSQSLDSHNQLVSHDSPCPSGVWKTKLEALDFDNTADLERFLSDAKDHLPRNILPSRSLKLGIDLDALNDNNNDDDENNHDMINDFWETVLKLLRVIGRHIWHIEIYNDGFETEASSFYGLLHRLLCFLPNVKTLRIICEFENSWNLDLDLTHRLGTWPLPSLPHLECLHILHCMPCLMTATIAASYTRQIRRLCVSVAILIHVEEEYLRGFLNLTELVLRDCVKDVSEFHLVLRQLEILESPNLEKLRLFRSYSDDEVLTTNYLLGLMLKFSKLRTLDTHRMHLAVINPPESTGDLLQDNSFVYSHSLKVLKLRNSLKLSLEFLLKMPNLQKICIRDEEDNRPNHLREEDSTSGEEDAGANEGVVDLKRFLYQGNVYESNIWVIMPTLNKLIYESFDDDVIPSCRCTRQMYEYVVKQRAATNNNMNDSVVS